MASNYIPIPFSALKNFPVQKYAFFWVFMGKNFGKLSTQTLCQGINFNQQILLNKFLSKIKIKKVNKTTDNSNIDLFWTAKNYKLEK